MLEQTPSSQPPSPPVSRSSAVPRAHLHRSCGSQNCTGLTPLAHPSLSPTPAVPRPTWGWLEPSCAPVVPMPGHPLLSKQVWAGCARHILQGCILGNPLPQGTHTDLHTPLTAPKSDHRDKRPGKIDGAVLHQHTLYPCESCSAHTPSSPSEPLSDGFAHEKCSLSLCQPQAFTFPVLFGAYNISGVLKHHSSLYSSFFGTNHPFPAGKIPSNRPSTGVPERPCKDHLCLCLPRCVTHLPGSGPLTCSQQLDRLMLT